MARNAQISFGISLKLWKSCGGAVMNTADGETPTSRHIELNVLLNHN